MKITDDRNPSGPAQIRPADLHHGLEMLWASEWYPVADIRRRGGAVPQTYVVLDGYPREILLGPFAVVWVRLPLTTPEAFLDSIEERAETFHPESTVGQHRARREANR